MYGTASEDTPPVIPAGSASTATPQISSPAVVDSVLRDPASSTFQPACRNAAPRASATADSGTRANLRETSVALAMLDADTVVVGEHEFDGKFQNWHTALVVRADGRVVRRTVRKRFRARVPDGTRHLTVRATDLAGNSAVKRRSALAC